MTGTTTRSSDEVILHVTDYPEDLTRAKIAGATLVQANPALRVRIIVNGPHSVASRATPYPPHPPTG